MFWLVGEHIPNSICSCGRARQLRPAGSGVTTITEGEFMEGSLLHAWISDNRDVAWSWLRGHLYPLRDFGDLIMWPMTGLSPHLVRPHLLLEAAVPAGVRRCWVQLLLCYGSINCYFNNGSVTASNNVFLRQRSHMLDTL